MVQWYSRDARWQGTQRHYYTASNVRTLIFLVFVVLVIVESVLMSRWVSSWQFSSAQRQYSFWARIGAYLIGDAVLNLIMAYFIHKDQWHPIAAVATAILAFGLWVAGSVVNVLIVLSEEFYFSGDDQWRAMCYGEAALQVLIAICYLVMMGFAAKAVHEQRKTKRQSAMYRVGAGYEMDSRNSGYTQRNGSAGEEGYKSGSAV